MVLDTRDENGFGKIRFITSGTLTVLKGEAVVSAYILAGGGGGYASTTSTSRNACGGGGGYQTVEVELSAGNSYPFVIGMGGQGYYDQVGLAGDGGNTTAFGYVCTGGKGGRGGSTHYGGEGGTPNGTAGTDGYNATPGLPNGGKVTTDATANNGGDGYVELTFG